uniref:CRIC domain-containing protein n=1 Tax=Vombatus ursinus TaxID=29139 RepID=A0A4X2KHA8_VOMUR
TQVFLTCLLSTGPSNCPQLHRPRPPLLNPLFPLGGPGTGEHGSDPLCSSHWPQSSGLETENLRKLTEQLQTLTHKLCSLVPGCLGASGEPAPELLTGAIELVQAAWALLCWLNRYLFSQINDFSACQEIGDLCRELAQVLQKVSDPPPLPQA